MGKLVRLLAILGVVSGLALVATPTPALAATYRQLSLGSGITNVTTTEGKHLHFYVTAFKVTTQGDTSDVTVSVTLFTGASYGIGERHTWTFKLHRPSFDYTGSNGNGFLNTGQQITPFGSMSLNFHKSSQTTTHCKVSGTSTAVKGSLHGAVHFDSNLGAWGRVNDSTFAFATPNYMTINNGCTSGEGTSFCFRSLGWSGPGGSATNGATYEGGSVVTSSTGSSTSTITGTRNVTLSNPTGATRSDSLTVKEPQPTVSNGTLSITTNSGRISGKATISGGTTSKGSSTCRENGHNKHQHYSSTFGAKWASPAGHHMMFDFRAGPDFTAPGAGNGSWSKYTVTA